MLFSGRVDKLALAPYAGTLEVALPITERSATVTRNYARKAGSGTSWAGAGTPTFVDMTRGVGASLTSAKTFTGTASQLWTTELSIIMDVIRVVNSGFYDTFIYVSGFSFGGSAGGFLACGNVAGGVPPVIGTTSITVGTEYRVGVRYRTSDNQVSFFINGVKEDVAGVAITASSAKVGMPGGGGSDANYAQMKVRDVRIYSSYLDDDAFVRQYNEPHTLYQYGLPLGNVRNVRRTLPMLGVMEQLSPSLWV